MVDALDTDAWSALKGELEQQLGQKDILVRATQIRRLVE
jgi:hypothetical protein